MNRYELVIILANNRDFFYYKNGTYSIYKIDSLIFAQKKSE
ncbi:hypothetical protein C8N37_104158 [Sphingobacterium faecium]|nr:hypothetical protein C8N37_104158 [Sphingobacterium faecium]